MLTVLILVILLMQLTVLTVYSGGKQPQNGCFPTEQGKLCF